MPPRIVGAGEVGNGPAAWYYSLPPITRWCATACFLTTVGSELGLVKPLWLALYWPWVYGRFEIWRLLTNNFFLGGFGFKFLFELIWLIQYGSVLERNTYMFNPAEMVYMLILGALSLALVSLLVPSFGLLFNASPLVFMTLYVWSRNFPDQQVSLFGIVTLQSFYLPFAFLAISLLQGASILPDCLGIAVGHVWWYLTDLYPRVSGRRPLAPPAPLVRWVAQLGLGQAPPPAPGAAAAAAPAGFRAFRGAGRRLGDD